MRTVLFAVAFVLASVLFVQPALADGVRVIVGFKGASAPDVVARQGGAVQRELHRAVAAIVPAAAVAGLRADPDVAYVEEDGVAEALGQPAPSQPGQTTPWGITRVDAPLTGPTGSGVKVAVIDTGIDLTHPDLVVADAVDFVKTTGNDDNGHGTHVSGTIAALNNTIGVVGVAPAASLYAVKVLDRRGSGWLSDVAAGIEWAGTNGMNVANMSLGASSGNSTLQIACADAETNGVLLVAAAGNSGDGSISTTEVSYPAAYDSVVAVGATTSSIPDGLASFSNTGSYVEMSAPGVSIYSTYKGGKYATMSGTSMASPHAAGMCALIWQSLASPSVSSVRAALHVDHARDVGPTGQDNGFGWGVVDWTPSTP